MGCALCRGIEDIYIPPSPGNTKKSPHVASYAIAAHSLDALFRSDSGLNRICFLVVSCRTEWFGCQHHQYKYQIISTFV